ncbi:class I SAM-dependent DNA methyltransferase [Streptomyces sp. DT9]
MTSTVEDIGYGAQFAKWYDRIFPEGAGTQAMVDALARLHPDPDAGTIEFGVGTGRVAVPLSHRTGQVTGVDSSPEMLAQLAIAPGSEKVVAVHADIRTYTDTRTYGLVYVVCGTLSMLISSEDQQETVRRAAELLSPGGRLVVETGNRPAVEALHDGQLRTTLFTPYPEPGTGLQTHSTLTPEIWQCSHIWYESDGSTRVGSEVARLTTPDEVDRYATAAGLTVEGRYSDWNFAPYTQQYPMFLTTYTKSA